MSQATGSRMTPELLTLLGPDAAAELTRPLTAQERDLIDDALARHGGDPVAALCGQHLPADVQAEIRRVMA